MCKVCLTMKNWPRNKVIGIGLLILVHTTLAADAKMKPVFDDQWLVPFWHAESCYQEPLLFIQNGPDELPKARLLFPPKKIMAFTSATGEIAYEEGKDYQIDSATGLVTLPRESRIPFRKKAVTKAGEPERVLFFKEGSAYHALQSVVTYTHAPDVWKGFVPSTAKSLLPKTFAKLHSKTPLRLGISGDSISAGYNASGFTKAAPYMPVYGELVQIGLEKRYGIKVALTNRAVAGWSAQSGLSDAAKLAAEKPDLVIIAYGMNDVSRYDAAKYSICIKKIMDEITKENPDVEFILVASMLGNPVWKLTPTEKFIQFRADLSKLVRPGVAMADVTAIWQDLLKRKSYYDLTGNGLNHPNDFGHRVYAQVILTMLGATTIEKGDLE